MMNPMQLMGMVQGSQNPMQLMQQMFGGNPLFNQAMQMGQGKSPEQLQQIVRNIAHTIGVMVVVCGSCGLLLSLP